MKKKSKKKIIKKIPKDNPSIEISSLPHGIDEKEFLRVVDNISKRLGYKFKFGYHDFDDMKQQAYIFALEGVQKYDNKRPLENFLWTHIRNRLFNYKRNNYQRPDKPCFTCPLFDKNYACSKNQCSKYSSKQDCELYASWSQRNETKKNIMQPTYIEKDPEGSAFYSNNLINQIENKELLDYLDKNIEQEYRENYLKLKNGLKVPKQQLLKLQQYIKTLIDKMHLCQKSEGS
jgi:DNA-directed RNA polymerase specialized sigma24 family protein